MVTQSRNLCSVRRMHQQVHEPMRSFGPSDTYDSAQQTSATVSVSLKCTSLASTGSSGCTAASAGCGLHRQRFDIAHAVLRYNVGRDCSLIVSPSRTRAGMAPLEMTVSRWVTESPAILPRPQIACSRTSSLGDDRSRTKAAIHPALTTTAVCSEVPDEILVRAHAASNWSVCDHYAHIRSLDTRERRKENTNRVIILLKKSN